MKKTLLGAFAMICVLSCAQQAKADVLISFPAYGHSGYYHPIHNAGWLRREEMRREWLRARIIRERQLQEWRRCHHGWR